MEDRVFYVEMCHHAFLPFFTSFTPPKAFSPNSYEHIFLGVLLSHKVKWNTQLDYMNVKRYHSSGLTTLSLCGSTKNSLV